LGEISVVFWATAEKQLQAERSEDLFGHVFSIGSVTDGSETTKLTASLEAIARGKALKEIDPELKPETKFYILGLTPNAARLSIRFWLETTFGDIHKHYLEH
jgi:CRISPR-associated protein Csd1